MEAVTSASHAEKGPALVVEDDEDIRLTFSSVLTDEGYRTVCAADGADALALLRRSDVARPRVILLDLVMPRMDAWKLRRELLKDERLAKIPIVLISGDPRVWDEAVGMGASAVLLKPITLEQLLGALEPFH